MSRLRAAWLPAGDAGLNAAAARALAAAAAAGVAGAPAAVASLASSFLAGGTVVRKATMFGGAATKAPLPHAGDDGAGGPVVAAHRAVAGAARRSCTAPPPWAGGVKGAAPNPDALLSPYELVATACSADAVAARHALAVRAGNRLSPAFLISCLPV